MTVIQDFDPDEDIEVVNLNDLQKIGASPKKPFALLIWNNITKEEAEILKEEIVNRYKGL